MEPSVSCLQKVRSQSDAAGLHNVIGFDEDARRLVDRLVGGRKQLQFISVVGMAGLGKTTLVKKVFDEPSVVYHFYVRAWTTVTQEPRKRDLLLGILKSGFNSGNDDNDDMELSLMLKQRLSGQRYLVVLDDIWDSKDWNDLVLCFPDDNVGSRIVFTTRIADVPLQVQSGCYQHPLRFLNEKESWDLLRYKVFLDESCPSSLVEIGKKIASKCHGLPLSIVVIAGILANDTTMQWWSQVAQDMKSIAPEQYMDTLVLSYNHLPDHLKPCFLYFAAFPEDYEIPAWKLILLWVAEGFVKIQTTENNLEDEGNMLEEVAAQYLKDLIARSLIIVSKRKPNGGIKSCVVHDALRDLCIKKADEVKFLYLIPIFYKDRKFFGRFNSKMKNPPTCLVQRLYTREVDGDNFSMQLKRYFHLATPSATVGEIFLLDGHRVVRVESKLYQIPFILPRAFKQIKDIFRRSLYPNVRTILAYSGSGDSFVKVRYTQCYLFGVLRAFKFLTVMDLFSIGLSSIPQVIESLLDIRYIALRIKASNNDYFDNRVAPRIKASNNDYFDNRVALRIMASTNDYFDNRVAVIEGLKHLETFIVQSERINTTPVYFGILSLKRLRHVILKGNFSRIGLDFTQRPSNLKHLSRIGLQSVQTHNNLQTLSLPIPLAECEEILEFTPNLVKLCINHELYRSSSTLTISNLAKLQYLESLSLQNNLPPGSSLSYSMLLSPSMFPVTLKKLTLVYTLLRWDEMQKIEMLPNLEVLKLQCEAFRGEQWETNDGGFCRLKHLSFKFMRFVQWSAYSEHFLNLQHLKLDECQQLEEIPISMGDIYTLEMIEIRNCNPAVVQSARRIKKDQMNKGNDSLKVSIFQA